MLAAIAGLAGLGLSRVEPVVGAAAVDRQLLGLSSDCKALLACAPRDLLDPGSPPGALASVELSLPPDTGYVAFGTEGGEGVIVYEVHGTRKAIALGGVRLRKGAAEGAAMAPSKEHLVIEGGGRYTLTVEYMYDRSLDEKYLVFY